MRAALLALLPLPILLVSVSISKLSGLYDRPAFYVPLGIALVVSTGAIGTVSVRALRGEGGRRRALWLAGIALAAAGGALAIFRTNPDRMAALREVVHIVEYGAIAAAALWLLKPLLRGSLGYVTTLGYVSCVGIVDELVQFYHPGRVGDLRDVLTDVGAGALGLLLANRVHGVALPPGSRPGDAEVASAVGMTAGGLALVFVALVKTGYVIDDPAIGSFRTRLSPDTLRARAAGGAGAVEALRRRQEREAQRPVFAIEDLYLTEARAHILRRDALGAPQANVSGENAVLETYYGPVLDALGARRAGVPRLTAPSYRSGYLEDLRTSPSRRLLLVLGASLLAGSLTFLLRSLR